MTDIAPSSYIKLTKYKIRPCHYFPNLFLCNLIRPQYTIFVNIVQHYLPMFTTVHLYLPNKPYLVKFARNCTDLTISNMFKQHYYFIEITPLCNIS